MRYDASLGLFVVSACNGSITLRYQTFLNFCIPLYFSFYELKICFQNRFLFLDRAGLYKHPSAKSLGSSKSAFPLVSDIVGGTDEEFLEKVSFFFPALPQATTRYEMAVRNLLPLCIKPGARLKNEFMLTLPSQLLPYVFCWALGVYLRH